MLNGKGSKNQCSIAIDGLGTNPSSCPDHGDGFIKLWPLMGSGHGGNYDGDVKRDLVVRPLVMAALKVKDPCSAPSPTARGSVQILRFRSTEYKGKMKSKGGDRIHMHVDKDKAVGTVALFSVGETVRFALDQHKPPQQCCKRVVTHTAGADRALSRGWHETNCGSCQEVELRSGDVMLFDGHPTAGLAHGVLDTVAGTAPAGLPEWARKCRVSLQYRCFRTE